MDTSSNVRVAIGTVIGARHQRAGRNGQDAAFARCDGQIAVAVVCDGCSSGGSSEVGARVGAKWFADALAARLEAGARVDERGAYEATRQQVAEMLGAFAEVDGLVDAATVRELLLFTIVAVAVTPDGAAVWALGDGAYGCDGSVRVLGPFADNAPPYLAYDLLGAPREAAFEVLPATAHRIVIATDGVEAFDYDLAVFGAVSTANPDGLRRRLLLFARADERVAWGEGRVVRTPAVLQDDCAVAIVERIAGAGSDA